MTLVHRVNFVSMFPGIFSCLYACFLEKKEITYVVHSIQVKCHRESMILYTCMHAYTTIFNLNWQNPATICNISQVKALYRNGVYIMWDGVHT